MLVRYLCVLRASFGVWNFASFCLLVCYMSPALKELIIFIIIIITIIIIIIIARFNREVYSKNKLPIHFLSVSQEQPVLSREILQLNFRWESKSFQ